MVQRSKDCHNEVIISSLLGINKRPPKENTYGTTVYLFYDPCKTSAIKLPPSAINIDYLVLAPTMHCQATRFSSVLSCIIDQLITLNRHEYASPVA